MSMDSTAYSVLFVCLGNICRSPTAHGVFEKMLSDSLLAGQVYVDSAGTAAYHIGKAPDKRATSTAKKHGYELSHLRARQVTVSDFNNFDLILAMDESNLNDLLAIQPSSSKADVRLFMSFAQEAPCNEVPDPYYGGAAGFEQVVDLVESASQGVLEYLVTKVTLSR